MSGRSSLTLDRPWVAVLTFALAFLSTAGLIGLIEPTETRFAEIAREMRATGDYLKPHLNGIAHFHKPPLAYWASAAGFAVVGENAWGARLPAALAALVTLIATVAVARRRFPNLEIPGGLAAWMLGTSLMFFGLGRSVATDPYLTASVATFWALAPSPWALAALGIGFLAKGPVVFVPTVLSIWGAAAWSRDRALLGLLGPPRGWVLFAGIALPWYLIVVARTPGLLDYLLGNQLWARFATHAHHRAHPWWTFGAVLVAGALPWTPAVLAGLSRLWRERNRTGADRTRASAADDASRVDAPPGVTDPRDAALGGPRATEARLLIAWLVVPLVFFSFSGSKLPSYLLPCLPAAALMGAYGLKDAGRTTRWVTAGVIGAIAGTGFWYGPFLWADLVGNRLDSGVPLPWPANLAIVSLAYASTWLVRKRPAPAAAALFVLVGLTLLLIAVAPYEGRLGSPRPLARIVAENRSPGEPVVEYLRFNAGLPFYLREHVRLLEVERELGFDPATQRAAVFVTRDSIRALAAIRGRVWILGPERETRELVAGLKLSYQLVAPWRNVALASVSRLPRASPSPAE